MMLVQKQPTHNLTPIVHPHHRRHPSAPPAVLAVQPTKTPGMLSISKPQRTTPQRHMQSNQRQQASRTAVAAAAAPKQPKTAQVQISPKKQDARGRAPRQPKDKKRISSPSPVRTGSRHTRQPSPPVEQQQQSLQAEALPSSHNQFDPFIQSQPVLSESIPVPSNVAKSQQQHQKMSRSAPKPTNMAPRPPRTFNFPVCDDDLSEPDSAGVPTPPATPMRRNTFDHKASPVSSAKGRRHRRAPSEGVFAMSSDEEVSVSTEDLMLKFSRPQRPPVTPASSFTRAGGKAASQELNGSSPKGAAPFFASSVFQNSPSPDELPNPLLF